jgi:hypothetical protein
VDLVSEDAWRRGRIPRPAAHDEYSSAVYGPAVSAADIRACLQPIFKPLAISIICYYGLDLQLLSFRFLAAVLGYCILVLISASSCTLMYRYLF